MKKTFRELLSGLGPWWLVTLALGISAATALAAPVSGAEFIAPAWAFALSPGSGSPAPKVDPATRHRLPGSGVELTEAQLRDLYLAPDWYPDAHSTMPEVVAHGARPDVFACGYCHTPSGQGRPENAPLAGLPAGYIAAQVDDFRTGKRRSPSPGPHLPTDLMIRSSNGSTAEQVAAAAEYFSRQTLGPRVKVVERTRVPRTRPVAWMHAVEEGADDEPLGERLIEIAPAPDRHELRDEKLVYVAYVPPGSIKRGRALSHTGVTATAACAACHGPDLRGGPDAPPLAGRSPSYLLRQLIGFRTGAREGTLAARMRPVVSHLTLRDMIAAVAYAASLPP